MSLTPTMLALVEERTAFADSIAASLWRVHKLFELEDLKAQAYLGLVQAAERWPQYCTDTYGPGTEVDLRYFNEFCRRRIFGEVIDYIRASDYVSRTSRRRNKDLIAAGSEQGVSIADLSTRTGLSVDQVKATMQSVARAPKSLETIEATSPAMMSTVNPNEESRFESEILSRFAKEIENLEPVYQVIIALHYYQELDLKKIAAKLNLAESKVSRLHTIAILTIHEHLKAIAA